jgi:type IV secretion system protein VirB10
MKGEEDKFAETVSERNHVTKNSKLSKIKDKLTLLGIIGLCVLIGVPSLFSKSNSKALVEQGEKDDASLALSQNMALITSLQKTNSRPSNTGYKGSNPNYPPKLKPYTESFTKETLARMNAPSTFFSVSNESNLSSSPIKNQEKVLIGQDGNSEFLNHQNDITSVTAKQLPHPALTVPAGEVIPATLETAINSELAGMVRAITTRDVYALSGQKLLIPKGSTLVGQFNSGVTQGQSRIFVVWNRLQMANGIIVTMNSPATDSIGRSGVGADYIDRHFFERFGTSALLSVLGAYSAMDGVNGQDQYNSKSQYRMNIANSFQQSSQQTLQQDMLTGPTLQLNQGAAITVFVAHDLDFYRFAQKV